jgi:hypothetical protein
MKKVDIFQAANRIGQLLLFLLLMLLPSLAMAQSQKGNIPQIHELRSFYHITRPELHGVLSKPTQHSDMELSKTRGGAASRMNVQKRVKTVLSDKNAFKRMPSKLNKATTKRGNLADEYFMMKRKYFVNTVNDFYLNSFYSPERFSYQYILFSLDNGVNIRIRYDNANYWNDSYDNSHLGIFVEVSNGNQSEEWYIAPLVRNEWIDERIVVYGNGDVRYYMNGEDKGIHHFNILDFEGTSNLSVDCDPYGWWYTHYHYMDDLMISTPATVVRDSFDDGVINTNIWKTPVNTDGVREEDGIMKMEQLRTDQDFHLRSQPIAFIDADGSNVEIPTEGLVAYYPFSGNANDESGYENHGSPTSQVTLTEGVNGDENGAYLFGGYDKPGHIYVANSESLQFDDGASFSLYIKPNSWESMDGWGGKVSSDGGQCFLAKEHDRRGITFTLGGNDEKCHIAMGSMGNESWASLDTKEQLTGNYLNKWTHVVFAYGNGAARLFIDGQLVNENACTPDFSRVNAQNLYFGKFSDSWYPFNGVIDEVRIYNRALDDMEVKALARFADKTPNPPEVSPFNIRFADGNVKALCVGYWDTDGDGELSYEEAAAVTNLQHVFSYNTSITSFDELQYFTGLTTIGDEEFESCYYLKSIKIPGSVTSIGNFAFYYCDGLTSIDIPASVTSIGYNAFTCCYNLASIYVEEGNMSYRSEDGVLFDKDMTVLICYPAGKPDVSYSIPGSVEVIYGYAFDNQNYLTSVDIPNSVEMIDYCAFRYCTSLKSIDIPGSVSGIGNDAFEGCISLASIHVEESNMTYRSENGVLFSKNMFSLICYPAGKPDVSYSIPVGVTRIESLAMEYCQALTSVVIPNTVEWIDDNAFYYCSNLTSVIIPNSVTEFGYGAFYGCKNLNKVVSFIEEPFDIDESVFYVGYNWETDQNIFTSATLYVPVGTIDKYRAAAGWNRFENILELDETLLSAIQFADANVKALCVENWDIDGDGELSYMEAAAVTDLRQVFRHNSSITSFDELQYFTGLTAIGYEEFEYCYYLESIKIPSSVTSIGTYAFYYCYNLPSIDIPASVTSIGNFVFSRCYDLASIHVEEGNTSYRSEDGVLFSKDMTTLIYYPSGKPEASYSIPGSVTEINGYAFSNQYYLTSVDIPNSVTSIGSSAFSYCTNLNSIDIPNSVTWIGFYAFDGCYSMASIHVEESNMNYRSEDGVLFDKDMTVLICYPAGKPDVSYSIPVGVTRIESWAVEYCQALTSVDISNTVEQIGDYAFYDCINLTSVVIPNSVTGIDYRAFDGCVNLNKVVSFIEEPFDIEEDVFFVGYNWETDQEIFTSATLYVPVGKVDNYMAAGGWSRFENIVEMLNMTPLKVAPKDPSKWNDLENPLQLIVEGSYDSPADLQCVIDYMVENEEWTVLTGTLNSGDTFSESMVAQFDQSKAIHGIKFRARDLMGNTINLASYGYDDVSHLSFSGIEDKVYTGDSLYQTSINCIYGTQSIMIGEEYWKAGHYNNNVNVGVADFEIEGVYPFTIGRVAYTFNITPQPLAGSISILEDQLVFNADYQYPEWTFTNEVLGALQEEQDYYVEWTNNFLPGTATLTIEGIGNYKGKLTASFTISKAPLTDDLYEVVFPEGEIDYDGEKHGVDVYVSDYVGTPTVTYVSEDGSYNSTEKPSEGGDYDVYLEIAEGVGYHGLDKTLLGSFTIYKIPAAEWAALQAINNQLGVENTRPWDLSEGIKVVTQLPYLTVKQGHITSINLSGKDYVGDIPVELLALPKLESLRISGNRLDGDLAALLAAHTENGGDLASELKYLDISRNNFTGNIGYLASFFPSLETLLANDNGFSEVSPMISSHVTNLTLQRQKVPDSIEMHVSDLVGQSQADNLPTILTYNHKAQSYDNRGNLLLTTAIPSEWNADSWSSLLTLSDGNTSLSPYNSVVEYKGANADVVYLAKGSWTSSVKADSWVPIKLMFDPGDVNFTGDVNVLDLQTSINYIFKDYWNLFNYTAANLWNDETINVQDVIGMVNTLMSNGVPAQANEHRQIKAMQTNPMASVYIENGLLTINSSVPVAAFDVYISGCTDMSISQALQSLGMVCDARQTDDGLHIIGYSMGGATLPVGENILGTVFGNQPNIIYVMLSDKAATEIPSISNETITTAESVNADLAISASANGIVLHTTNHYETLSWCIYQMSGSLIDEGSLINVSAGDYILYNHGSLREKTLIVKVNASGNKEMIKKIYIK